MNIPKYQSSAKTLGAFPWIQSLLLFALLERGAPRIVDMEEFFQSVSDAWENSGHYDLLPSLNEHLSSLSQEDFDALCERCVGRQVTQSGIDPDTEQVLSMVMGLENQLEQA